MWFFTLVLVCVAGYFLYHALQDYRFITQHPHELTTARQQSPVASKNVTRQYKNTRDSDYPRANSANKSISGGNLSTQSPATISSQGDSSVDTSSQRTSEENAIPSTSSAAAADTVTEIDPTDTTSPSTTSIGTAANEAAPIDSASAAPATKAGAQDIFLAQPQGKKDDLTKIKGIGKAIQKSLNTMGVYHFHQLADFKQSDIDFVNNELDFPGRIERDSWIDQAKALVTAVAAKSEK